MCSAEKRGENTGRETWALGANCALPNSSYQLISLLGELKADSVEWSAPEEQRSAVTRQGLLQTKLLKKLALTRVCCCAGLRVSRTWKLGLCDGQSWAGFARAGRAVADRLLLRPGCPGSRQEGTEPAASAAPALRGAKNRHGIHMDLPQLSRLSARETWEVIGASGRKTNSLYRAPKEGWAVSVFGEAKSPGLVLCALIIS